MGNVNAAPKTRFNNLLVERAYQYYLKGLNAVEIGTLLNISPRTIQRYARDNKFKELATPETLQNRAKELFRQGHSYREIASILRKSRTTVYYYLKDKGNR
ncbi:helix-turn-helix domain-containing protein [Chitinophaga sp. ARDCPP14]|uniref:helix-turn-helix domain-containing protein n=1 Tax=Chitinophaga sp. ARDCPP14 TaxID=3391139 RepID=UPI003F51DA58